MQLNLEQARLLALNSQGLLQPLFDKGKSAPLAAIQHLSYVQIDTLSLVARAHHHILWSRVPTYSEKCLHELVEKDRTVFEYWSHAAAFLPMSDYRFSLPQKKMYAEKRANRFIEHKKIIAHVLRRIKKEGPLQSKDFEDETIERRSWYDWKPAKRALELLLLSGKLMVTKRQGFQKVYDLTERVLLAGTNTTFPTSQEYAAFTIESAIRSHGLITEIEITYLRSYLREPIKKTAKKLLKEGSLQEVSIDGFAKPFITTSKQLKALENLKTFDTVHLLSPFDNLVIQRKRLLNFFGFDYTIECYVPEAKRQYGYFCLPVLHGDKFVARLDPKADRAAKIFYIKAMHFEKGFKPTELFNSLLADKLLQFAVFNGCNKIIIQQADSKWKKEMTNLLK